MGGPRHSFAYPLKKLMRRSALRARTCAVFPWSSGGLARPSCCPYAGFASIDVSGRDPEWREGRGIKSVYAHVCRISTFSHSLKIV